MTDKTINPLGAGSGYDYATLQGWEDASDVTGGLWRGLASGNFTVSSGEALRMQAPTGTPDATHYVELTTASGQSFQDDPGVRNHALRFGVNSGCSLSHTDGYSSTIVMNENYARLNKLQITATGNTNIAMLRVTGSNCRVDSCIVEGTRSPVLSTEQTGALLTNLLIVERRSSAVRICVFQFGPTVINCTIVVPSDITAPSTSIFNTHYGSAATLTGCVFIGNGAALRDGDVTPNYAGCFTDAASPPGGVTAVTYDTALFVAITDAARDYRIPTGSAVIDGTLKDATNAPNDISGMVRSSPNCDAGVWEFTAAVADKPPPKSNFPLPLLAQ